MAGFQVKKMNWARTMGAYESMTAWREKRKAFQEKYEAKMQDAVSALQTAWTDQGYNIGEIAAKKAMARIDAEAKARQEKLAKASQSENNQVNAPKRSIFSITDSTTLDGGSKVDLSRNTLTLSNGTIIDLDTGMNRVGDTLTLSDGTVIDMTTGMKKIDVTV